jgi:hypothetical protein
MLINKIFQQLAAYAKTPDYVNGIFVQITGTAIELLLLSILLPLIIYLYKLRKSRQSRMIANFYLFQVFHKIARNFLSMASIEDPLPILLKEMINNDNFKIYSNYIYGNLENILFVLSSKVFTEGSFGQELQKKDLDSIKYFKITIQESLDELDRLISMYVSIPKTKELLFNVRLLIYPIRDVMENLEKAMVQSSQTSISKSIWDLESIGSSVTNEMMRIFSKERKVIDSIQKHRIWMKNAYLLVVLVPIEVTKRATVKVISLSQIIKQKMINLSKYLYGLIKKA